MTSLKKDSNENFVHGEPKLTLTGAKAKNWVPAKPGTNLYLVLGIINYIKSKRLNKKSVPETLQIYVSYTTLRTQETDS